MAGYRREKIEGLIREVVAEALLREIKDPRIGFATITEVKLNKDSSVADVGVSIIGDEKEKKKTMMGINSASGYIQHIVSKEVRMRHIPRLNFFLDTSIEEGVKLVGLINGIEPDSNKQEE